MNEMGKICIGVDIGGTSIKMGLVDTNGAIQHKWEIETNKAEHGKFIVQEVWSSIENELNNRGVEHASLLGIGIGAPGFIDSKNAYVFEAVNIGWKNVDLGTQFQEISNLPTYLENDANVAVLGENWQGAGNNADNVIAITLGTGVGGGIIANGEIIDGANGTAGEIGHMTIDPNGLPCNCGRKGCLETIASATGFAKQGLEMAIQDPAGMLAAHYQKTGHITAKDIFDFAADGDQGSMKIIDRTTDLLGLTIANLATVLNPSKVLIGGGVSKAGNQLVEPIREAFQSYALTRTAAACEMKVAQLGNDAGLIGAAYLVLQHEENNNKQK